MTIDIQHNISLKTLNTFGIDAYAAYFATLSDNADIVALLASKVYQTSPVLWLGGGSNILFTRDFLGLVVKVSLCGTHVVADYGDSLIVEAAAGEIWHHFVRYTLEMGWYGLENLSFIPGTVGACPIQNIGAYGVEVKDYIVEVICADLNNGGARCVISGTDCQFDYRNSIFKHQAAGRFVITAVRFRLSRTAYPRIDYGDIRATLMRQGNANLPTPLDISNAVIHIRTAKLPHPTQLGNAGSFFKNPVVSNGLANTLLASYPTMPHYPMASGLTKLAAGWLIDQAGLKGYREGDAGVHNQQALVLVNYGNASGIALKALANRVQATVAQRYGIELETEPLIL